MDTQEEPPIKRVRLLAGTAQKHRQHAADCIAASCSLLHSVDTIRLVLDYSGMLFAMEPIYQSLKRNQHQAYQYRERQCVVHEIEHYESVHHVYGNGLYDLLDTAVTNHGFAYTKAFFESSPKSFQEPCSVALADFVHLLICTFCDRFQALMLLRCTQLVAHRLSEVRSRADDNKCTDGACRLLDKMPSNLDDVFIDQLLEHILPQVRQADFFKFSDFRDEGLYFIHADQQPPFTRLLISATPGSYRMPAVAWKMLQEKTGNYIGNKLELFYCLCPQEPIPSDSDTDEDYEDYSFWNEHSVLHNPSAETEMIHGVRVYCDF